MTVEINPKLLDVVEFADRTSQERFSGTAVEWLGGPSEAVLIEVSNNEGIPTAFKLRPAGELTKIWEFTEPAVTGPTVSEAQQYFENGVLFLQNGLVARAKEQLAKSFSIDPTLRGTVLQMANLLGAKGAFDTALFVYNLLLELSPEYSLARENMAVTFLNRGVVHAQNGLIPQAIEEFNQALMLNPSARSVETIRKNIVAAYTQLGIFYSNVKQYQLAFQWFQLALELDPSDISRQNLAVAMIAISTVRIENRTRQSTEAIFRQPLRMGLALAQCLTAYGATVASLGDLVEARWAFQAALHEDPSNAAAKHNLEKMISGREPKQDFLAGLTAVETQSLRL